MTNEKAARYAPVLGRMVEIMGSASNVPFGLALRRASVETGVAVQPDDEASLLLVAFRIIATGKLPGCPEA